MSSDFHGINETKDVENVGGTICVNEHKIVVTDPIGEGEPALIISTPEVTIYVDDQLLKNKMSVYSKNNISYEIKEEEAKREVIIKCINNQMQALISVKYNPKIEYTLKNTKKSNKLQPEIITHKLINPPLYTIEEIRQSIAEAGIVYGINNDVLQYMCSDYEVDACVFAEGKNPVAYIEDRLEVKFQKKGPKFKEDLKGTIDYKAIGHVTSVEPGQVLAEIVKGREGSDGIDVKGKVVSTKRPKNLRVIAGPGTEQNGNEIKATIKGKPLYAAGKISVTSLHEIRGNVDLTTGNIMFSGHVVVFGSVLEGMIVEGTAGIEIYKSVANSEILSNGNISIDGNGLMSQITAGGTENTNKIIREKMDGIAVMLKHIYDDCNIIKNKNVLGYNVRCGEIVKILLEKKYKDLTLHIKDFLDLYSMCEECDKRLIINLKCRMIGAGPLTIEKFDVILDLINSLNLQSQNLRTSHFLKADIKIAYCQDCILRSTGNIYINGRGDYQSNIKANEGVYFMGIKSIVRGGKIDAGKVIKCNFVGSEAGVKTELKVDKNGEIFANFAYHNTKLIVGNYEYTLQEPCKNIHVYLDNNNELKIDKFKA